LSFYALKLQETVTQNFKREALQGEITHVHLLWKERQEKVFQKLEKIRKYPKSYLSVIEKQEIKLTILKLC